MRITDMTTRTEDAPATCLQARTIQTRADDWPLCPTCGEDELWSPLIWDDLDVRPPLAAFIAAGLRCYLCGWEQLPARPHLSIE